MAPRSLILLERAGESDVDLTRAAWRRYVADGRLDPAVRPHVARAWRRSVERGCDPHRLRADTLSASGTADLLAREAPLVSAARPFLNALSRAAGADRHAAMLADGQVRVLDVVGDQASVHGPEAVPGPGSLLEEANAGANGHGTAIAEGGYVELVGPEHFIEGFHAFTCQGIPLIAPDGAVAGVIGVSVRRLRTARRVRDILFCAARGVECELLSRWVADTVAATARDGVAVVAERLRQDLVQRLAAGRLRLEVAADRISRGGDAAGLVKAAGELIERFGRLAAVWRDLVTTEPLPPEPIVLRDLASDLLDLLGTEARMADVTLTWGASAAVRVLADRRALAQEALGRLLTAFQGAGAGGRVQVDVTPDPEPRLGVLQFAAWDAQGRPTATTLVARATE